MLNDNLKSTKEYINKCHKYLLILLKFVDKVCKEHNIKYTLSCGTLIGAIREHGFVPWDDDGDINLKREEYEKLMKALKTMKLPPYIGVYYPEEQENFLDFSVRLYYKKERLRNDKESKSKYNGVFSYSTLDIYVLDNIPSNPISNWFFIFKQQLTFGLAMSKRESIKYNKYPFIKRIVIFVLSNIGKLFTLKQIIDMHNKVSMSYRYVKNTHLLYCTHWLPEYPGWQYEKQLLSQYIYVKFENTKLMVMKEYHKVLVIDYGDYMNPKKTHQHDDFIKNL